MVRGRLLLTLERPASAADIHRPLAQEVVLQPLLTFTDGALQPQVRLEVRARVGGDAMNGRLQFQMFSLLKLKIKCLCIQKLLPIYLSSFPGDVLF